MKNYEAKSRSYFIRSITSSELNNTDSYDRKYTKIKFNSDDSLPLMKTLELHNIIVNRFVFHEGSKYYLQDYLDKCLFKLPAKHENKFSEQEINVRV